MNNKTLEGEGDLLSFLRKPDLSNHLVGTDLVPGKHYLIPHYHSDSTSADLIHMAHEKQLHLPGVRDKVTTYADMVQ